MTSQAPADRESTGIEDAVLDATRDCVLAYGVRRTTLTDVAKRAGVSRMSIYRRWPDVQSLVADLMSREWHAVLVAAAAAGLKRRGRQRTRGVAEIVAVVRGLREHPLLRKIKEVDPEILLPYMLDRRGASQEEMLEFVVQALRTGQQDGSIRAGDPERMGRAILLAAQPFALSAALATDKYDATELDAELTALLDAYLSP
ncbi:TetR/AcrR family transcriptional regulator [Phytohabitans houttuyneae]|uniref:TetR family transcriptional regulator n=1 Tax=Phytohabitans houttuyneae TaxID=1076126 RepID=A0A6V8K2M5_9ACTN|nr:TetR/AcrR family transcriptional regulator [Phytohabitans houttuyneae]GFJ76429.1 TetR family transcriptional regulator [Phytohabitans houttuyneae]